METTDKTINRVVCKLKKIADKSKKHNNLEKEIAALRTIALLKYKYNQEYVDDYIEERVVGLSKALKVYRSNTLAEKQHTVLFYDGFGLDTRGIVQIYLKALVQLKYRVIYITKARNKSMQPQVIRILSAGNSTIYNIKKKFHKDQLNYLRQILNKEDYSVAFFYTTPFDIVGAVAFCGIEGKCKRYLINLTDHAFWVGRSCVDYCIEFREYGANISYYYRGFNCEQLLELPYYPILQKNVPFQGFPDGLDGKKVIFSGGSLYKTLDNEGTYYRIVERIVSNHSDVGFLYAGSGDDTYIKRLVRKYPEQVFFISERNDLYEVLKHSYLYLNSFPISGALMLQYAAVAMCIPVTLKYPWDDDASGILMKEELLAETFINEENMIKEIDHLLIDENYRNRKREILSNMVISEEEFTQRLYKLIEKPISPYKNLTKIDTRKFRKTYKNTFKKRDLINSIINRNNIVLFPYFFKELISKIVYQFTYVKEIKKK